MCIETPIKIVPNDVQVVMAICAYASMRAIHAMREYPIHIVQNANSQPAIHTIAQSN